MTNSQRRLIVIATLVFAGVQLIVGFGAFMNDSEGGNLLSILPGPVALVAIGVFVWMGRDRGDGPEKRPGRIMKGPWQ